MIEGVYIVLHSDQFAMGGYWSGTEGRQHQPYLAMIPLSRYRNGDEETGFIRLPQDFHRPVKPRPKPRPKPLREPKPVTVPKPRFDFTTPNFHCLYTEMKNHGIIDSVKTDLLLGFDNVEWYVKRLDWWLRDFRFSMSDTTLNHIQLTRPFMDVLLHEYRKDRAQVLEFLTRCFSGHLSE